MTFKKYLIGLGVATLSSLTGFAESCDSAFYDDETIQILLSSEFSKGNREKILSSLKDVQSLNYGYYTEILSVFSDTNLKETERLEIANARLLGFSMGFVFEYERNCGVRQEKYGDLLKARLWQIKAYFCSKDFSFELLESTFNKGFAEGQTYVGTLNCDLEQAKSEYRRTQQWLSDNFTKQPFYKKVEAWYDGTDQNK